MTRVYLARHGETEWNALGKLQGRTDIPLNEVGLGQARALAERLKDTGITTVVTSDLSRARVTGSIVADALGVTARHVDEELRERSFGVFEGLTREECGTQHPDAWRAWVERAHPPESAEPREVVAPRMMRAIERAVAATASGACLVVSHGGAMRIWLLEALGQTVPPVGNGAVYRVDESGGSFAASLWEEPPT